MIFALVVPIALFLLFGLNKTYVGQPDGEGNVSAFIMISISLYGAVLADHGRRRHGVHRAGRRLEPPAPADAAVPGRLHRHQAAGRDGARHGLGGRPCSSSAGPPASRTCPPASGFATGLSVWVGSLVFAAFGLFLGYLLPTENVMQFLGLIVGLLAFAGGLFVPLSQFPSVVADHRQVHARCTGSTSWCTRRC